MKLTPEVVGVILMFISHSNGVHWDDGATLLTSHRQPLLRGKPIDTEALPEEYED